MIVMKFGGTSMGSRESIKNVANIVKHNLKNKPVVVVSAMSGVTDSFINSAQDALKGHTAKVEKSILTIRKKHEELLLGFGDQPKVKTFWAKNMEPLFVEIELLLQGIAMLKELSPRSLDNLSSFGERLSSYLLVFVFDSMKVKAERFDTREILRTDSDFGSANVDFKTSKTSYKRKIIPFLQAGGVPVLTGYIGADKDGNTTTLGRGGSDYSASIAGILLGAKSVEIWTDVDGILTANPRDVENTKLWQQISFQEAAELAYSGAKVLHPKTIHPAVKENIDVVVKNTFNPLAKGTVINKTQKNGLKGVTITKGVNVVYICSDNMLDEFGFVNRVSSIFSKHGVSIDVITTSEVTISISVNGAIPKIVLQELSAFSTVNVTSGQAKVCLVGTNMCSDAGFLSKVFHVISKFTIHMISFGYSNINLTLIVDEKDCLQITRALHKELF